ncbi:hypothetical protein FB45DRAFT_1053562 [Roridomyces roridus]|uniref:Uncharacterized protein n=1 Tax=Roridomyces roridus TaxID=1738132 RepID=A0AAD7CCM8_9AGAR|nr:hypothetical protein FB45DRAFT_1053562 [Roridomyces roridus]
MVFTPGIQYMLANSYAEFSPAAGSSSTGAGPSPSRPKQLFRKATKPASPPESIPALKDAAGTSSSLATLSAPKHSRSSPIARRLGSLRRTSDRGTRHGITSTSHKALRLLGTDIHPTPPVHTTPAFRSYTIYQDDSSSISESDVSTIGSGSEEGSSMLGVSYWAPSVWNVSVVEEGEGQHAQHSHPYLGDESGVGDEEADEADLESLPPMEFADAHDVHAGSPTAGAPPIMASQDELMRPPTPTPVEVSYWSPTTTYTSLSVEEGMSVAHPNRESQLTAPMEVSYWSPTTTYTTLSVQEGDGWQDEASVELDVDQADQPEVDLESLSPIEFALPWAGGPSADPAGIHATEVGAEDAARDAPTQPELQLPTPMEVSYWSPTTSYATLSVEEGEGESLGDDEQDEADGEESLLSWDSEGARAIRAIANGVEDANESRLPTPSPVEVSYWSPTTSYATPSFNEEESLADSDDSLSENDYGELQVDQVEQVDLVDVDVEGEDAGEDLDFLAPMEFALPLGNGSSTSVDIIDGGEEDDTDDDPPMPRPRTSTESRIWPTPNLSKHLPAVPEFDSPTPTQQRSDTPTPTPFIREPDPHADFLRHALTASKRSNSNSPASAASASGKVLIRTEKNGRGWGWTGEWNRGDIDAVREQLRSLK